MTPATQAPVQQEGPGARAVGLALVAAVAMPIVYVIVPFAVGVLTHSGDGLVATVVVLALVGAATWIAALVLALRTLAHASRTSTSPSYGLLALLLCLVGLFTGGLGCVFGFIFGAGGGPH